MLFSASLRRISFLLPQVTSSSTISSVYYHIEGTTLHLRKIEFVSKEILLLLNFALYKILNIYLAIRIWKLRELIVEGGHVCG